MLSKMLVMCVGLWAAGAAIAAERLAALPEYLAERPWLDQIPREGLEKLRAYYFAPERTDHGYVGIFVDVGNFRVNTEVLFFDADRNTISFHLPSGGEKVKSSFTIAHEQHGDFDLVLKLGVDPGRRGSPQVYYSKSEWEDAKRVPAWLVPLVARPAFLVPR